MKSKTAIEYAASMAGLKAAQARAVTAKQAIVDDVANQIHKIIADLTLAHPELKYTCLPGFVDTSSNSARKRPKIDLAPLYFQMWVNPYFRDHNLDESLVRAINIAHYNEHDAIVQEIIKRLEEKGEWKFVEGSTFRYSDGPERGVRTAWAMIAA